MSDEKLYVTEEDLDELIEDLNKQPSLSDFEMYSSIRDIEKSIENRIESVEEECTAEREKQGEPRHEPHTTQKIHYLDGRKSALKLSHNMVKEMRLTYINKIIRDST